MHFSNGLDFNFQEADKVAGCVDASGFKPKTYGL